LSSIFDAFVGEYHVTAFSVKRVEDPCRVSLILLSEVTYANIQRQKWRRHFNHLHHGC